MTQHKKSKFWPLATLIVGIAIGLTSQRIPELKFYTDEIIRPIERSDLFTKLKTQIGYHDAIHSTEPYPSHAQHDTPEAPHPTHPISSFLIHRPGYSLAYDASHHNPAWVYEHLTAANIQNDGHQLHSDFKEDTMIPQHLRATLADYRGRSLDRGQMAPVANHRANQDDLSDTFYLSNICPLCPQLNEGYWSKLEQYTRDLTKNYRNIYVITGPLYLPYNENGGRFVKYRVIGPNDVAVPSHFFKVLILEDEVGKKEMVAYVLPNYEIPLDTPLENFKSTIQKVENAAGIIFQ
jgi:endonuclease G